MQVIADDEVTKCFSTEGTFLKSTKQVTVPTVEDLLPHLKAQQSCVHAPPI